MSIVFSNPSLKSGICELVDSNVNTDLVSYPMIEKVRDANIALDIFNGIAIEASGMAQFDDSNHTKDPFITFDLVSGQSDYHFTTDEEGSLILDIYRVMIADSNGVFRDLECEDQQSRGEAMGIVDGQAKTGKPGSYDKTGNAIYLDLAPDYSYTNGIKLFINRETTYFTSSDTTKKPGIDGRLQEYIPTRMSAMYAGRKGLSIANFWANEVLKYEGDKDRGLVGKIARIYSRKRKDEVSVITPETIDSI
jgi:hypothetical protein